MINSDTGILLNEHNIKLHRWNFNQMVKLIGIMVQYEAPKDVSIDYNLHGEFTGHYDPPETIGCIYDEHPTQKTMKLLGWNAELADTSVLIHVPYDLKNLQAGAVFTIPAGLDRAEPRRYRVLRISNIAVYPASVTCELGPLLDNEIVNPIVEDFTSTSFNLLDGESEKYGY